MQKRDTTHGLYGLRLRPELLTGGFTDKYFSLVGFSASSNVFGRSKKEFDRGDFKNVALSSIVSVTDPVFEKKTGRRNSILGGGNTEDGHVIRLMQKNGFSIDLKVKKMPISYICSFLGCYAFLILQIVDNSPRTGEQWKEAIESVL